MKSANKVRYAVIGQGWFSQVAVLPAFAHAGENSELAALVTGDPTKAGELGEKYQVPAYGYEDVEKLPERDGVNAVYIVLPNSMHAEYTIRAARAGMHVLCEKPMASTVEDCRRMIDACDAARVRLMIAYRLHFEEANLRAVEVAQSGRLGRLRTFHAFLTQQVEGDNTRVDADLGGGPLEDVGIYCINAARYVFREEPLEAVAFAASTEEERFREVPEMVSAILRFPDEKLASFTCGFGEAKVSTLHVVGTKGDLRMDPAFTFHDGIHQEVVVEDQKEEKEFPHRDQVAAELLYFSSCVLEDREPEPSGQEGLIDMEIIAALYRSIREGRPIRLDLPRRERRPSAEQSIRKPPVKQPPEPVRAASPSGS